jgi:hypothetical protein
VLKSGDQFRPGAIPQLLLPGRPSGPRRDGRGEGRAQRRPDARPNPTGQINFKALLAHAPQGGLLGEVNSHNRLLHAVADTEPPYPAAHGAGSGSAYAIAAYLFPRDVAVFTQEANDLTESRLWAGIHYQTDIDAGLAQGRSVAQK